ncbi:Itga9p [Desmophyllum pertusum]|uniref:Itga9p n=1 Tax=Desmophyllum pertusum TaxID=174260 RepID=A0A9W9YEE6_9CNID|nr:Itga9p [Desmophyllum pertusum]
MPLFGLGVYKAFGDDCRKAVKFALQNGYCSFYGLDTGYIDLFLIHSPTPGGNVDSYKAMLKLKEQGVLRSAGVSNFVVNHLKEMEKAGLPTPAVNQIELNRSLLAIR